MATGTGEMCSCVKAMFSCTVQQCGAALRVVLDSGVFCVWCGHKLTVTDLRSKRCLQISR